MSEDKKMNTIIIDELGKLSKKLGFDVAENVIPELKKFSVTLADLVTNRSPFFYFDCLTRISTQNLSKEAMNGILVIDIEVVNESRFLVKAKKKRWKKGKKTLWYREGTSARIMVKEFDDDTLLDIKEILKNIIKSNDLKKNIGLNFYANRDFNADKSTVVGLLFTILTVSECVYSRPGKSKVVFTFCRDKSKDFLKYVRSSLKLLLTCIESLLKLKMNPEETEIQTMKENIVIEVITWLTVVNKLGSNIKNLLHVDKSPEVLANRKFSESPYRMQYRNKVWEICFGYSAGILVESIVGLLEMAIIIALTDKIGKSKEIKSSEIVEIMKPFLKKQMNISIRSINMNRKRAIDKIKKAEESVNGKFGLFLELAFKSSPKFDTITYSIPDQTTLMREGISSVPRRIHIELPHEIMDKIASFSRYKS